MILNKKILVVEDDSDINGLLCKILIQNGYDVRGAYSGSEAKMCIEQFEYDLIILDLMLPGVSGEELIKEIRKNYFMPIIVSSAKTSTEDKISVLKLGADDFIIKPFDINELLARVEAQLRRYTKFSTKNNINNKIIHKNLELDIDSRQVFVNKKEVNLTVIEFDILNLLITNPNKVFTRSNLFESVWNDEFMGYDNTVNVHVSNLRNKISKFDKDNEYIQTVWGIGFKLKD
ncbi:response regulator transcription factor [Clostridium sp.]|jgi:DNA-binding response OmpR family regulator|uniref:response regulator transcription factor n=1 Tax=Clostridium sp. TaxID=1506 RepID=UPI0025C31C90|nr:response regulator transcription factor [Clostridium sp.]MCI9070065.1 response regulator transcription factor [Clostridium sp.]